jgi:single-strand DNA-binding protein
VLSILADRPQARVAARGYPQARGAAPAAPRGPAIVVRSLAARRRHSGSPSATSVGAAEFRRFVMFNEAHVILSGRVAKDPQYRLVGNNVPRLSMRVVWTTRRRDSATGEWVDGNTSGVNVTCWRKLAENLNVCLRKGDPVLVRGKLEVCPYVGRDGQSRTAVDVDAITVGPDLTRGVAHFLRVSAMAGKTAAQQAAELAEGENGDGYDGAAPAGDDGAAALAAMADGDGDAAADDDMFDDSAIEALAKDADSVATPF